MPAPLAPEDPQPLLLQSQRTLSGPRAVNRLGSCSLALLGVACLCAGPFLPAAWPARAPAVARQEEAAGPPGIVGLSKNSTGHWITLLPAVASASAAARQEAARPLDVVGLSKNSTGAQTGARHRRKGSFLVIGDWGWDAYSHGTIRSSQCQRAVASAMDRKMRELGDVQFVINLGDSFYPGGVSSKADPQWNTKWRDIYSSLLRSVPWYSVYGNHDYWRDPCACSSDVRACAQHNSDPHDLSHFYFPNHTWFLGRPDLGLEVVALDLNQQWISDCWQTPCLDKCRENLGVRAEESLRLFYERKNVSTAPNLVVFSHYPTDFFRAMPEFLAALKGGPHHIEYFGGHRHNVDQTSTASIAPNNNWLVGGGGGWGCDGTEQGFIVSEVGADDAIATYPVLVEPGACC